VGDLALLRFANRIALRWRVLELPAQDKGEVMKRLRGSKPSPAMVVSIIALVLALAGSAAAGIATISVLSKKEKKQTRNIAKDEIKKAAPGLSVANATNAQNASALSGVGLNSVVTGASESLGGCDPSSTTFVSCASVTLDLPRAGRVLGWADLQWHTDGSVPSRAECQMRVDDVAVGHGMFFGEAVTINTSALHERGVGGNFITTNLTAGPHTFSVNCNEPDSDIDIDQAAISVLLVGTS
jgi:hypothetical protein